jgi:hypothetical protein
MGWKDGSSFPGLGVVIIILAVSRDYTAALPRIKEQSQLYKKVLDTGRTFLFKNSLIEQYGGFRKYINEKVPYQGAPFPDRTKRDSERNGCRWDERPIPISGHSPNSRQVSGRPSMWTGMPSPFCPCSSTSTR